MYSESHRQQLLHIAKASIKHGLEKGRPLPVRPDEYDNELQQVRASFVTLKLHGELRGCIGRLHAERPLVEDIAENAFSAAFRDPRFAPLTEHEFPHLEYHISILDEPVDLPVTSENDLIEKLIPGKDGLILEDGLHRGTFLPSVWESLPNPRDFVRHLKMKAGLPGNSWSDSFRVQRYRVEEF